MIEEDEILSLVLFLKGSDACAIEKSRVGAEENAEGMTHNRVASVYPLFLLIFLIFICHKILQRLNKKSGSKVSVTHTHCITKTLNEPYFKALAHVRIYNNYTLKASFCQPKIIKKNPADE